MALIEWSDSLSVNVTTFDNEHRKLIDMINDLNDAMKNGKSNDVLGEIISRLIDYTGRHFKSEEQYFAQYGYPNADAHRKEHQELVKKVVDIQERFNSGQMALSIEVMNFLRDWLRSHIKKSDKAYTTFFNDKGLT